MLFSLIVTHREQKTVLKRYSFCCKSSSIKGLLNRKDNMYFSYFFIIALISDTLICVFKKEKCMRKPFALPNKIPSSSSIVRDMFTFSVLSRGIFTS